MTEEIKKLIEEEADKYSERIKKNTSLKSNERIAATAGFARGATIISKIILSKWQEAERWRKVSEELPKHKKNPYPINIRNIGRPMSVSTWDIRDESDIQYLENMKGCEWKPIS